MCLAMTASGISFTSCSDDDDEEVVAPVQKLSTLKADYSISLSDDWFKFFDIEVTYTSTSGVKNLTLTENKTFSEEFAYTSEPKEYVCKVVAKPKANAPTINPEATYVLKQNIQANVSGYYQDGSQDKNYGYYGSNSGSYETGAQGLQKYMEGEHKLLNFSYSPEK